METDMKLTNEEVLDIAESMLDYSDFGNWYGKDDAIVEFAYKLIQAEKEKQNVMASE